MLKSQLKGVTYNKTAHRNALLKKLPLRNGPSVEFKRCNISAILYNLGLPYIEGYKPRQNYQQSLEQAVVEHLSRDKTAIDSMTVAETAPAAEPPRASAFDIEAIEISPPGQDDSRPSPKGRMLPAIVDWARRQSQAIALGRQGEEFAFELERKHLSSKGRDDLAAKVKWVSRDEGDGAGYDILSFDLKGVEKYIEVKTTNGSTNTPFFASTNEVEFSHVKAGAYWIYRLVRFSGSPRLYRLNGPISIICDLEPIFYRARPKATAP